MSAGAADATIYRPRLERLRAAMHADRLDALFLNHGPDYTWLTGLPTPVSYENAKGAGDWVVGLLVLLERDPLLVGKASWAGAALDQDCWISDVRLLPADADPDAFLAAQLRGLGLERATIAVNRGLWAQTLLSLQHALPEARCVVATTVYMDQLRGVKDAHEIAIMERAAAITDAAFGDVVARMRLGMSERDVLAELDYQIRRHGGDGVSFMPTIVVDGAGARRYPQIISRDNQPLTAGLTVAFDFGVVRESYCSDFGRSVFMGEPRPEALAAWQSLTRAQLATMAVMGDGAISPAAIHDFVVARVTEDGFREQFSWWALGHSIGLDVHEDPWMLPNFTAPIRAGMCFALEPKIGRPGAFYVRCEDVVVVEAARARPLTRYAYEPIVIA
jgi:Xaa-Pro aminopeptidase